MPLPHLPPRLLPSVLLFAALLAAAVGADALLHRLGLAPVGRWLGIPGTLLLLLSFPYSLRKRGLLRSGSPKTLLALHETLSWVGALLLLVHGGIHANAWIPWLALAALVVVVASGLTGKYLLAEARRDLADRRKALAAEGVPPAEAEDRLEGAALLVRRMQEWRSVHLPLTAVFAALALVHILATVILW